MDDTASYTKWTKDALVRRIRKLENELRLQTSNSNTPATEQQQQQNAPPSPPPSAAAAAAAAGEGALPSEPAKKKAKKTRILDPSKYATRYIALKLAYVGKRYNGFEYQSSGHMSTIEEELWKALVKGCLIFPDPARPDEVDWSVCEYSKCGRTDRGVSAFGQVVALRVRSNKPLAAAAAAATSSQLRKPAALDGEIGVGVSTTTITAEEEGGLAGSKDVSMTDAGTETSPPAGEEEQEGDDDAPFPVEKEIQYCRMLNRLLPPDIRVYAWCPSPGPDFSARFNCRERQYRYFFTQPAFAPLPNFLEADPSTSSGSDDNNNNNNNNNNNKKKKPKDGWLDIDAMRQAAKLFEGLHDFRNFCKVDPSKQITNFTRRIYEADIVEVDGVDTCIPYLTGPQFRDPNIVSSSPSSSATASPQQPQQPPRYPKVYYFQVRGSAFLWHQIRCMIAVLFLVGQELESPGVVASLLDTAAHPRRPNYVLADDTPLVLWDCVFGRDNAEGAADELDWVYVGNGGGGNAEEEGDLLDLYGPNGLLAADLWASWREKKMDEILANQLVGWIAEKTGAGAGAVPTTTTTTTNNNNKKKKLARSSTSTRVYEGGNGARSAGQYVPVLAKDMIHSPEEQNDRYARRKGFADAEAMRARGNWREVIRAAKEAGEGVEGGIGGGGGKSE